MELLESRLAPAVSVTNVNDNWHFVSDNDSSGTLSFGDEVRNDSDINHAGSITAFYGLNGFGTVTTGEYTGSLAEFDNINDAIAGTNVGGTVNVLEGTYAEQVVIEKKSLTMQGAGALTVIAPSSATQLTSIYTTGTQTGAFFNGINLASIIQVSAAAGPVNISNLTMDGANVDALPAGADQVVGILYGETGGLIDTVTVQNMDHVPVATRTHGMWLDAVGGTSVTVEVRDSTIQLYNRTGIVGRGDFMNVSIHDNTITGPGTIDVVQVLNGVLLIAGAGGTITANTISAHHHTGSGSLSAGVLLFAARDGIVVAGNEIFDVDDGVLVSRTNLALIQNNVVHDIVKGIRLEATSANNTIENNIIQNSSLFGVDVGATAGFGNILTNNTLTDNAIGINIDGGGLGFGAGNTVTGGTTGLAVSGATASITDNTLGDLAFSGQSGQYIALANAALDDLEIDATSATFKGFTGATNKLTRNFALEDRITHAVDDATLGFVRVKADKVYVTPNSGSIQRGIDAASSGDTINIQTGSYSGNVSTAATGVMLSPGPGAKRVTIDGDLTLDSNDSLFVQIRGRKPGRGYDQIIVSGAVQLGDSTLQVRLRPGYQPPVGKTFKIIQRDGTDESPTGQFAGRPQGSVMKIKGMRFRISYHGGDGNDVTLTRIR